MAEVKFKDEIAIMMCSALGIKYGEMTMPEKMEKGLIKAYFESGTVRSTHLYIKHYGDKKWKEVTDGLNHNPYSGV